MIPPSRRQRVRASIELRRSTRSTRSTPESKSGTRLTKGTEVKSPRKRISSTSSSASTSSSTLPLTSPSVPSSHTLPLSLSPSSSPTRSHFPTVSKDGKANLKTKTAKSSAKGKKTRSSSNAKESRTTLLESIRQICQELSCETFTELYGYESEKAYILNVINNTVVNGESTSLLVCGGKGFGKTLLIENSLQNSLAKRTTSNVRVVRLSGSIHGNDLGAIRLMAKELDVDVNGIPQIVSQISEICTKSTTRLIFIVDEFDIFCRRQQTFLYNLFDLSQRAGSICIIGLTTRMDCSELLEKRVKSRMNQRIITLQSPFKSFDDYIQLASDLTKGRIELTAQVKEALQRQYNLNRSVRLLKRLLFVHLTKMLDLQPTVVIKDTEARAILSFSHLELTIMLLAAQYIEQQNMSSFNISVIVSKLKHISALMNIPKAVILKAINNLMDAGLVTASSSRTSVYLTDWTQFQMNIDYARLKQLLANNDSHLPLHIKKIIH